MPANQAAWDEHSRWLSEMRQEYTRRVMQAEQSRAERPSGCAGGGGVDSWMSSLDITGDEPVYRSVEMHAGGAAGGGFEFDLPRAVYRGADRGGPTQWTEASNPEVDEEWKLSFPPMLQRQRAFTR
jgi:hypothetical protein